MQVIYFAVRVLPVVVNMNKGDCTQDKGIKILVVQWGYKVVAHCPLALGLALYAEKSALEQL